MKQLSTRNSLFFNNTNNNYIKHSYVPCAVSLFDTKKINFILKTKWITNYGIGN